VAPWKSLPFPQARHTVDLSGDDVDGDLWRYIKMPPGDFERKTRVTGVREWGSGW
jgi:hypothetical protein